MTITITHPRTRTDRTRTALVATVAAAALSVGGFFLAEAVTGSDSGPASGEQLVTQTNLDRADTSGLVDWARSEGLSGLSPASATGFGDRVEHSSLAEWAEAEGVSGLSPASATADR